MDFGSTYLPPEAAGGVYFPGSNVFFTMRYLLKKIHMPIEVNKRLFNDCLCYTESSLRQSILTYISGLISACPHSSSSGRMRAAVDILT